MIDRRIMGISLHPRCNPPLSRSIKCGLRKTRERGRTDWMDSMKGSMVRNGMNISSLLLTPPSELGSPEISLGARVPVTTSFYHIPSLPSRAGKETRDDRSAVGSKVSIQVLNFCSSP
jgi:hypothetical protein